MGFHGRLGFLREIFGFLLLKGRYYTWLVAALPLPSTRMKAPSSDFLRRKQSIIIDYLFEQLQIIEFVQIGCLAVNSLQAVISCLELPSGILASDFSS